MKKNFVAACVLSTLTLPALAEGFYVSGDVGQAKWEVDSDSETDTGFGVAGGYKFNNTFAVEAGYRDLGSLKASDDFGTAKLDISAIQLSVLANHSFNDSTSIYGRLGFADVKIKASYDDGEDSGTGSDSKNKAVYGVGGRYAVNEKTGIHIEYDRYAKYEGLTISTLFVGIDFQF